MKMNWGPLRSLVWAVCLAMPLACSDENTEDKPPVEEGISFERLYPQGCGAGVSAGGASGAPRQATHLFDKGFLWGSAVAGFQVDMGCPTMDAELCEDRASDWYQWVSDDDFLADKEAMHLSGDPVSTGPGFWETWRHDLRCAAEGLGNNAFRMSLEWSRLFPDGAAEKATTVDELDAYVDEVAAKRYAAIFAEARKRGLTPLVTLNHYTLPLWIHNGKDCHVNKLSKCEDRGWLSKERMLKAIALYAGWCGKRFGDKVDLWATLNEPFAVVLAGYILPGPDRTNPPGVYLQVDKGMEVAFNMMEGHARMYDAVKANDKVDADGDGNAAEVGLVHNLAPIDPSDPNDPKHQTAADHLDHIYNRVFLEATINGKLDRNLDGIYEENRPDMAGRMDYLGINYYTRIFATPQAISKKYKFLDAMPDLSKGLWNNYPEGLERVIRMVSKEYKMPVIVSENGTASDKSKAWEGFVKPHIEALWKVDQEPGVTVRGYFYWSFVDNYEWNHGMAMRFGMYALDTDSADKTRTPTAMVAPYRAMATANGY